MSHIGLERIEALFQTWPESFKKRFLRELRKDELMLALTKRSNDLELKEITQKFENYSFEDLCLVKKFLDEHEVDFILTEIKEADKSNAQPNKKAKKLK